MPGYVSKVVKVYLLDDHDIVRRGLRDLLVSARDIQVVGDSSAVDGAARRILELDTDVMVLDLQLQDGTGVEVCRAVRAEDPSVTGLLLTSSDEDEALAAALLAGAGGYIVKASRGADIAGAVRRLGGGRRSMIDHALAEPVIARLRTQRLTPPLTEHERVLLDHVLAGRTDGEIADLVGADVTEVTPEVAALVGRFTQGDSAGRHRRD
jgi:two-component system response regulator DevR